MRALFLFCVSLPLSVLASEAQSSDPHPSDLQTLVAYSQVDSFEALNRLAAETAACDFVPKRPVPQSLASLKYDQYVKIAYKYPNATWWGGDQPFWIETFHQGFVQREQVLLFVREQNRNRLIPFSPDDFTYDLPRFDLASITGAGHAGIKIAGRFPGGSEAEILTFLGSSYFRARSEYTVYGASARGLAIDVATDGAEEFPFYRAFWVDQPTDAEKSLTILALMDSPSVAGAYRFEITPGLETTTVDVKTSLHFRQVPEKVAIAPLTSMWIWGDGLEGPPKDARPSVHDSDGLLVRTASEKKEAGETKSSDWTWRAFSRPPYPSITSVPVTADGPGRLTGFGLMQRNTAFYHFDDHNAHYHKRPSIFVTPRGEWPAGRIELLEMPGEHEGIDNIGAYFIPDQLPTTDTPMTWQYEVAFFGGAHPDETDVATATAFQLDRGKKGIEMEIRFAGKNIAKIDADAGIEPAISTIRGEVLKKKLKKTETGDWLLTLLLDPTEEAPMELKATLQHQGKRVSETFAYLCPHEEPTFVYPDVYTR